MNDDSMQQIIQRLLDHSSCLSPNAQEYLVTAITQALREAGYRQHTKVDEALREIAFHVPVCTEYGTERVVDIEEVFKLKRIAADAREAGFEKGEG